MRTEEQIDFKKNVNTALDSLEYLIEHPHRASFKKLLPRFINRHLYGTQNSTVFNLATHLCLIGFHEELPCMEKVLLGLGPEAEYPEDEENEPDRDNESDCDDELDPKEQLEALLNYLYDRFNTLSSDRSLIEYYNKKNQLEKEIDENPSLNNDEKKKEVADLEKNIESHNAALKGLKKLIHQFARENGFPCKLVKLDKLNDKLRKKLNSLSKTEIDGEDAASIDEINEKIRLVSELRTHFPERKYASLPTASETNFEEEINEFEKERAEKRKVKSKLNKASLLISVLVGVGEGLVAAMFATATFPFLVAFLVVGILGFICNFVLFRGASFSILKDIVFGKIWTKQNGKPLTRAEKAFVVSTLVFSLGAGCSFGFLAFGSGLVGFAGLFAAIGLTANPIGILVVAGLVALVTSIALFTVFAYLTVTWIRNGGPGKLKNKILNLKNDFIAFWKHAQWSTLTLGEKVRHVATKILVSLRNFLFFVIAVVATTLLNIATIGIFKHQTANIFHTVFKVSSRLSSVFSWILVAGLGGIINAVFYTDSLLMVLQISKTFLFKAASTVWSCLAFIVLATFTNKRSWKPVGRAITKAAKITGLAILNFIDRALTAITKISFNRVLQKLIETAVRIKMFFRPKDVRTKQKRLRSINKRCNPSAEQTPRKKNYVRFFHRVLSKLKFLSLIPSVIMNAVGQGLGSAKNKIALSTTHEITRLNHPGSIAVSVGLKGGGSAGANAAAAKKDCSIPDSIKKTTETGSLANSPAHFFHNRVAEPEADEVDAAPAPIAANGL